MSRRRWKMEDIKKVVSGENPFLQVGYTVPNVSHKPGDVWTDAMGITWEQKNGYKVRVNTQVNSIREMIRKVCKLCHKDVGLVGNRYDDKFYLKTGMCYDCVINHETQLVIDGNFSNYEKVKVLSNQVAKMEELKQYILDSISWLSTSGDKLHFASNGFGDVETWSGFDKESLLETAKADLEKIEKDITESKQLIESLK